MFFDVFPTDHVIHEQPHTQDRHLWLRGINSVCADLHMLSRFVLPYRGVFPPRVQNVTLSWADDPGEGDIKALFYGQNESPLLNG